MKKLVIFRLLTFSVIMLSTGVITGWWLHEKIARNHQEEVRHTTTTITLLPPEPAPEKSGFFDLRFKPEETKMEKPGETSNFILALDEERVDDALIIYQQIERTNPSQLKQFRQSLDKWLDQQNHELAIKALLRFTQHYYQDEDLLNRLASRYEKQEKYDAAIQTLLGLKDFTFKESDLKTLTTRIHNLSKELFQRSLKQGLLVDISYLFQRLSAQEPEFGFYRYALSQIYISLGDTESAIYELEILQLDPEFGRHATQTLAALLPPAPPEEPKELPAGSIPADFPQRALHRASICWYAGISATADRHRRQPDHAAI